MIETEGIKYPAVPPYDPEEGEVLMARHGWSWHPKLRNWLRSSDPALPFRFPGTPAQVYAQARLKIEGIL